MRIPLRAAILATLLSVWSVGVLSADGNTRPDGFVYLDDAVPNLVVELRYFGGLTPASA